MLHAPYSKYKTWVEVDSRALVHNLRVVQKHVGKGVTVMAIIKSNAYGHGMLETAKSILALRSFSGGGWFGVDSIDEALALKKAGIKNNPILILGYIPKPMLSEVVRNGFRLALYDSTVARELTQLAKKLRKKAFVHIKLETGTCRQGVAAKDSMPLILFLKKNLRHIVVEGAYSHFADSENASSSFWKTQLATFGKSCALLEENSITLTFRHISSSAATLFHPEAHFNMVRLGISLYGLYPSEDVRNRALNALVLKPALAWKTRVAQVKRVEGGSTIGYDRTFTALHPMTIAVLPVGYWDGFDRRFSNTGVALIRGRRVSVVGRVCMNMVMVDVSGVSGVCAGDEVVLIGRQGKEELSADDIAKRIGTINYEIITRINPIIPRIVV